MTRGFATHIRAEIVHKGWNACVDRCRVNGVLDSMLFGRCLPRVHIFIRCFTFFFPFIFPFTFGGAVRFERFKAMDRSRKKKTSVETRRNRGFKGLEETLSGCKIARRTFYNPSAYFSAAAWLDRRASSRNRPIMRTRWPRRSFRLWKEKLNRNSWKGSSGNVIDPPSRCSEREKDGGK